MPRPKGHRLDDLDLRIIQELIKTAQVPIEQLGEKVGLPYSPCRRRIKWLEKNGFIRIRAVVSRNKSKWKNAHFMLAKLPSQDEETFEAFVKQVLDTKEVISCDAIAGQKDFILRIETPDNERLEQIRRSFVRRFPKLTTEIIDILRNIKRYRIPPEAIF
jgi:DNA-binding Lrp family transcriptional regulator